MISRRNFISITIMMLVLLFMLQSTQIYYEYAAKIDVNRFYSENAKTSVEAWEPDMLDISDPDLDARYVLFLGNENGDIGRTVKQWCYYTKRNLVVLEDLEGFPGNIGKNQEYVMVESTYCDVLKNLDALNAFAEAGVSIVFCDLPEVEEVSRSSQLRQMLGIRKIKDKNMTAAGIKMFSGFLLGGEVVYQADDKDSNLRDDDLEMPWYQLSAGAQTYMVGLLDEKQMADDAITRENLPALLWSYSDGRRKVFAVNGDYLHDNTGVGILSAIDATLNEYTLYPILNAQLLTVANYPGLADENAAWVHQIFSSGMVQAGRDVVFPQMVATAKQTGFTMSCMLQIQYDYHDAARPKGAAYRDYLKLMKEAYAEMGISLERMDEVPLVEKMEEDKKFLKKLNSRYRFGAVYAAGDSFEDIVGQAALLDSINTVVSGQYAAQELIALRDGGITLQTITGDAGEYSFRSDLYMRSAQTALGYTNVLLDLNRVFWPDENEDSWEKLSKRFADNLYTHWRDFQAFEDVTVSQNDQKIRQLLSMDYSYAREESVIKLNLENTDQTVSFVLRLHNEKPVKVVGGTYVALEEGAYLIRTSAKSVEIHLTDNYPIHN
jgi:hypothetical protein